jgi:3'-phosphoadenosine 5'-phosphosulfate sulfotransferase (PAPS reductase)/FAD synthetase
MLDVCGCLEFAGGDMREEMMKKDGDHRFGCEPCSCKSKRLSELT